MNKTALILCLIGSCLPAPVAAMTGGEPTTKTLTYKTIPGGKLDLVVHYPPGWKDTDKRPAVVFFFGGGWENGRITQFETQADHLARRGMVAARADYRVKSRQGVTPDECVEDAKSAVRWLRASAAKLGIDPERIVAAGGSAGGHIAACTALTDGLEAEGEDLAVSSKPNALVLFNPVLRFVGIPQLMSRIGNDEALGRKLSPTLHVTKHTPPSLVLFGTADRLKPQGDEFMGRAKEVGIRAELFTAEDQPHGFFNRPPWLQRTTARMDEFLTSLGYLEEASNPAAGAIDNNKPQTTIERPHPKVWTRSGPLGETPQHVTAAYPLSDQQDTAGWIKFEPMSDEFEGRELDGSKWVLGMSWWKGRQPALFSEQNVGVSGGKLHLTMRKEPVPPEYQKHGYHDYTSAALHTKARSSYGYYEVKARPMDSGGSSSFWFQQDETPGWATEIDVFEIGGKAERFEHKLNMTVHVFRTPTETGHWQEGDAWVAPWRLADDFHVYGLDWGPDEIVYYVDGVAVRRVENTHWHQPLYLIFDSETMPEWFGMPDDADLPSTFSIEYVRAWKRAVDAADR